MKSKLLAIFILIFCTTSFALEKDVSLRFQASSSEVATLSHLRNYKILMVRGFLSDYFELIAGNFSDQVKLFQKNGFVEGVDYEIVQTDSEASSETNAGDIIKAIRDSQKPVIILSHSKGSVDTLMALMTYPELQSKVKGWVTVQGALKGTVIANNLTDNDFSGYSLKQFFSQPLRSLFRFVVEAMIYWSSGSSNVLNDLRTDVRESYLVENESKIQELSKNINILSIGSWQLYENLSFFYQRQIDVIAPKVPLSDGLVEPMRAVLPFNPYVILSDVDHKDLIVEGSSYNRETFTLKAFKTFWSLYGQTL